MITRVEESERSGILTREKRGRANLFASRKQYLSTRNASGRTKPRANDTELETRKGLDRYRLGSRQAVMEQGPRAGDQPAEKNLREDRGAKGGSRVSEWGVTNLIATWKIGE